MPAIWQDQRALKLPAKGAKPLGWVGIRVKHLIEAGEMILKISRCSGKLSSSTNDAEGGRAGKSSYAVGVKRTGEYPYIGLVAIGEGVGDGPKSLPVLRMC